VYHAITTQAFSQHPNYFGNVALWSGILLMNTPALLAAGGGGAAGKARFALALCSPLFMGALFYGQASGAMLNVGDLAEKKYGAQEGYRAYVQNTPLIVPGYKHLGGVGV
jgi:steroid 5-alpha reductase family enzyme